VPALGGLGSPPPRGGRGRGAGNAAAAAQPRAAAAPAERDDYGELMAWRRENAAAHAAAAAAEEDAALERYMHNAQQLAEVLSDEAVPCSSLLDPRGAQAEREALLARAGELRGAECEEEPDWRPAAAAAQRARSEAFARFFRVCERAAALEEVRSASAPPPRLTRPQLQAAAAALERETGARVRVPADLEAAEAAMAAMREAAEGAPIGPLAVPPDELDSLLAETGGEVVQL